MRLGSRASAAPSTPVSHPCVTHPGVRHLFLSRASCTNFGSFSTLGKERAYPGQVPRAPRQFVEGGIYHVASRGSNGQPLFVFDDDRRTFLNHLEAVVHRYPLECVSYCLMGNHYHLVVRTLDGGLSHAMRQLNGGYSRYFNRNYGRTAHLFRSHFMALPIEDESYLLTVCRYVAHNPVRAGLCSLPDEWPWSSHRATAGLERAPRFLNDALLREACGADHAWQRRYRDFVSVAPPLDELLRRRNKRHLTEIGV